MTTHPSPSLHPRLGAGAPSQHAGSTTEASTRPAAPSGAAGSFTPTGSETGVGGILPPFSKEDAARFLGISVRGLERLVKARQVPHVHLGSRVLFPRGPLAAWLDAQAAASMETRTAV